MNIEGMITEIMVGTIGVVYGIEKIVPRIRARRNGKNMGNGKISREQHDRECDLKLGPMQGDISEIKSDVKELLRRNGGPRT